MTNKIGYIEIVLRVQDSRDEEAVHCAFDAHAVLSPLIRDGATVEHMAEALNEIMLPMMKAVTLAAAKFCAEEVGE